MSAAAGQPTTDVTAVERGAVDLDAWPDGIMGFTWSPDLNAIVGSSPNGAANAAWLVGNDGSLLDTVLYAAIPTAGLIDPDTNYAAGGNTFNLPSGRVISVYHGEEVAPGSNPNYTFWSFLGIQAYPPPSFLPTDCGRIVTPAAPKNQAGLVRNVEVAGGAWAVKDGYFYVFYRETVTESDRRQLSIARCLVTDLDAAVALGGVPTFDKYDGIGWDEAGLGGVGADTLDDTTVGDPKWFDVIWLEQYGCWMLGYSWYDDPTDKWGLAVRFSDDLLNWSAHQTIGTPEAAESLFITLTSPLTQQDAEFEKHSAPGGEVWLFATRSLAAGSGGDRWSDATVEKHVLTVRSVVDVAEIAEGLNSHTHSGLYLPVGTTPSEIGAQQASTELAALASVTSAADKVPIFTGTGTADTFTMSSFMRALMDETTITALVAAMGVSLGYGVSLPCGIDTGDPVGSISMARGRVYWVPIPMGRILVPSKITHVGISLTSGVPSCTATVGVVDAVSLTEGIPRTLLSTSAVGAVDLSGSSGMKMAALSSPQVLQPFRPYFLVTLALGGSSDPTVRALRGIGIVSKLGTSAPVYPDSTSSAMAGYSQSGQTTIPSTATRSLIQYTTSCPVLGASLEAP